ncbi:hypothetical protein NX722_18550 [Endozoicomonas gorgoniicola]|uniref:Uncharacterized protein n=1 Tax=Endozoicomonas gorgoniicola TaxID=1234144 RepID=A0ABT3MYY3_9GAMM|nr:hypothetical protein [Endozoicomonas gorgoniicola]MCW7554581.1 hypothetical protein [Endozoicomonas gorgoniicola]
MLDLAFLRLRPFDAVRTTGFIVQLDGEEYFLSGRCNVTGMPFINNDRIVILNVRLTDAGEDWYCGYKYNDVKSLFVPFGQPDGTLILTFPMSGCALEVRREEEGNRIYHDDRGACMPQSAPGVKVLRVDACHYMDWHSRHIERVARVAFKTILASGSSGGCDFQHTIICVKQGHYWKVYNNASSSFYKLDPYTLEKTGEDYYQAKDYIQYELGCFPD